jgi:hypothetical protein
VALDFENFLTEHPTCAQFYEQLENESRKLAMDAAVVPSVHGADFHAVADEIIGYVRHRYTEYAARYVARSRALEGMQAYFDKNPSVENLKGHGTAVNRDDYNLALLLSIVLTNHRFEILKRLREFLSDAPLTGRLAALGTGTGYEMKLAATALPGWLLESYDIDSQAEQEAKLLLGYFGITHPIHFGREFPIDAVDPARRNRYDKLIACEVLEHLRDPARALSIMREYLKHDGLIFATMAVNIAQEDHIFWYRDLQSCRRQLSEAGLRIVSEWVVPQSPLPPALIRTKPFHRGNFVAVAAPSAT